MATWAMIHLPSTMDRKTKGAWVVHHADKLDSVMEPGDFERIKLAGKCGRLLASLAASDQTVLKQGQVVSLARAAHISPTFELAPVLRALEEHRIIDTNDDHVQVIGLTTTGILDHVGGIFDDCSPTPEEQASVYLAELASQSPVLESHAAEETEDRYEISSGACQDLFGKIETIGFTDHETYGSEKLYFNGNLFRVGSTASKVGTVLASLTPDDRRKADEVERLLRARGCMHVTEVTVILGETLFRKLNAIGLWDINELSNSNETTWFITRPGAFGKFGPSPVDDAFDLAKAFVAALFYGMHRSTYTRGQITNLPALLRKLINGNWVGPVRAIGEDYKILELRRVIEVAPADRGFSMRLLKRDVGELALKVLIEGDASDASLETTAPSVAAAKYKAPERTREITRRNQHDLSRRDIAKILQDLRSNHRR